MMLQVDGSPKEPTIELQLKNQRPTTEVGRGLEELGLTLIPAGSPQGSQVLRADEHGVYKTPGAKLTFKQEITTFSFS